jgi:UDP-glucose 4-epimerase
MSRRVLIVGGAGYIGAHCARELEDAGTEVVVFDNLSTGHRAAVRSELLVGDVRDREALRKVFASKQYDAVMHFAAKSLVGESVNKPLRYYDVNVGGTAALLSEMQGAEISTFVFSSTCAIYGDPDYLPLDEEHPKRPVSPYGNSKLMVEQLLDAARACEGFQVASLRYFNAAGAHPDGSMGESHSPETHLIPLALQALLGIRGDLSLFGRDYDTRDGTCIRDYIHVCDLAVAHRLALDHLWEGNSGRAWNLGTGNGTTVLEVLDAIHRITGRPVPYNDADRRPGDPPGLYAAADKVKAELGWEPSKEHIDQIVADAWSWIQNPRY